MLEWKKVSLMLCIFGFLRELRPSEPYLSDFILGEWRNITEDTLNKDIYPVGTYSYLSQLVIVFLITDYLRYKPLVVVSGICGVILYTIFLWTVSVEWLQFSQVFYGLFLATEVGYYTYIFAKVDEKHYEKVSSWTRAAALMGRFISGLSSQLIVSFELMNVRSLSFISFASQLMCTFWALLLPNVDQSIYFHRKVINLTPSDSQVTSQPVKVSGLRLLWEHACSAYKRPSVVAWSLWYAISFGFFTQVQYYVQLLWRDITSDQVTLYNGLVESALTVLGTCAALLAGRGGAGCSGSRKFLPLLPALVSGIQAGAVVVSFMTQNIWWSYSAYVIIGTLYHYMITIASSEIAHGLVYDSCFGLVFGINTLGAAAVQSVLTFVVISEQGLELAIRDQFKAVALCYMVLSITALLISVYILFLRRRRIGEIAVLNVITYNNEYDQKNVEKYSQSILTVERKKDETHTNQILQEAQKTFVSRF